MPYILQNCQAADLASNFLLSEMMRHIGREKSQTKMTREENIQVFFVSTP